MRLQEHLEVLNEDTARIKKVADAMTRVIMGDAKIGMRDLAKLVPFYYFDGNNKKYNKAYDTLYSDILKAINKATKSAGDGPISVDR